LSKELTKIRTKIVDNLKSILELQNKISSLQSEREDLLTAFFLNLIEIVDSFENKISALSEKHVASPEAMKIIKSFEIIKRKIQNILKEYGVTQIEFPNNKLIIGFSKAVATEPDSNKENDSIISVVRNGYIRASKVIREAELIVVKN